MFGIDEKKETEKAGANKAEQETSDEIQFDFEENEKLPFDDEDDFDEEYASEDEEPAGGLRRAMSKRTLLLGLLFLLVIGGAGYYLLSDPFAPVPKPAAPVKAKVAVQPAQPAPAPAAAVKTATPAPVAVTAGKVSPPTPAAKKPVATDAKAVPVAKTVAGTAAIVSPAEVKGEVVTPAALPVTRKPFSLSAGAFISKENQHEVEKKIHQLGYTPKVETAYSMVPMTRLLLGIFADPAAAEARRQELVGSIPDIFTLKQGTEVALYAGSYQDINKARRFADQLYQRGILADEETVSLRMPLKKIIFGAFASRSEAEKVAKRAAASGLKTQVHKR